MNRTVKQIQSEIIFYKQGGRTQDGNVRSLEIELKRVKEKNRAKANRREK